MVENSIQFYFPNKKKDEWNLDAEINSVKAVNEVVQKSRNLWLMTFMYLFAINYLYLTTCTYYSYFPTRTYYSKSFFQRLICHTKILYSAVKFHRLQRKKVFRFPLRPPQPPDNNYARPLSKPLNYTMHFIFWIIIYEFFSLQTFAIHNVSSVQLQFVKRRDDERDLLRHKFLTWNFHGAKKFSVFCIIILSVGLILSTTWA